MSISKTLVVLLLGGIFSEMTWSLAQQSSTGVLTMQDYDDIRQLYGKYAFAIDSANPEAFAGTLARDDGSVSFYQGAGHDAMMTLINTNVAGEIRRGILRRHLNTNLLITPTKEGADAACYLLAINVGVSPPAIISASQYQDKLVKTPEGWRFKRRVVTTDGPPAGAFAVQAEAERSSKR